MKTNLSILILSLFFISKSLGQIESIMSQKDWYSYEEDVGDFIILRSTTFSYFSSGKIKEEIIDYYDDGVFEYRRAYFYEYNEDESLLLRKTYRRYNLTVNIWVTISWIDYTYDINGCNIKELKTVNLGGESRVDYERNSDCQITKRTNWPSNGTVDTLADIGIREYDYFPDGISYEERRYRVYYGDSTLNVRDVYRYNANGLLEELEGIDYSVLDDSWSGRKRTYTYDQYGNVDSEWLYINDSSNPDWRLAFKVIFQNEYDDQFRIVKSKGVTHVPDGGGWVINEEIREKKDYDYECEDLVAQETWERSASSTTRFIYHYEGENDCFEVENISLEMMTYPNPTLGSITIQSPVFQSGNTLVSAFDISGRLLLEEKEIGRMEKVEFDLSGLPNGMYVIQLMNQEHFVQEKVMVMH